MRNARPERDRRYRLPADQGEIAVFVCVSAAQAKAIAERFGVRWTADYDQPRRALEKMLRELGIERPAGE